MSAPDVSNRDSGSNHSQFAMLSAKSGDQGGVAGRGNRSGTPPRVLAIASGGGHWVQLLRMRPAWDGCDIAYATTHADYEKDVGNGAEAGQGPRFYTFPDANRWQKLRLVYQLLVVAGIIVKERPAVVISTGASAGYFALRIAKYFGRRTIWIDSIANAEELSLAGKRVQRFADLWLTQWPHLARAANEPQSAPQYFGAVL